MLSGGGARGAYQVGFLRVLAREFPDVVPGILTGVSAGGINAAYLAAQAGAVCRTRSRTWRTIWCGLHIDDVFRVDVRDLAQRTRSLGRPAACRAAESSAAAVARASSTPTPLRELLGAAAAAEGGPIHGHRRAAWPTAGCARSR